MSTFNHENFRPNPHSEISEVKSPSTTTELAQAESSGPSAIEQKPLSFLIEKGLLRNTEKGVHFNIVALSRLAYDLNTNEARNTFTVDAVRDLVAAYRSKLISKTAFNAGIAHLKRVPVIGPGSVALALDKIDRENEDLPSILAALPVENENALTKQPSYLPVTISSPRQAQRLVNTMNFNIGPESHNRQGEVTEALDLLTAFLSNETTAPNMEDLYNELCKKFVKGIPTRFYEVLANEAEQNGAILELLRYICKEQGLRVIGLEVDPSETDDKYESGQSKLALPENNSEDEDDRYFIIDLYADGTPRRKKALKIGDGDELSDTHLQNKRDNWEF